MKHLFLFVCLWISMSAKLSAQNAFITFTADRDCDVSLYETIETVCNPYVVTKTISLSKNKPVTCQTPVSVFAFIKCEFSHGMARQLLLFPNDSVKINVAGQITFSSTNQAGLEYLNSTLKKATSNYMSSMTDRMMKYTKQEMTFNTMSQETSQEIRSVIKHIHNDLATSGTSSKFIETLQKNTEIEANSLFVLLLRSLLGVGSYREVALKDSAEIVGKIDSIFKVTIPFEKESLKYNDHNLIAQYLIFYHGEKCPPNSNADFLGDCGQILYAPANMRPILLGETCIRQIDRKRGNLDLIKIQQFLESEFPDNEYTSIIGNKLKKEAENSAKKFTCQYIKEDITTLSQLKNVDSLTGKYVFVDIWASWCMPCRKEFAHKERLHNLLSSYPNSTIVYVSIDNENQEGNWKQCIQNYQLEGVHLRASAPLLKDIQQQVYGTEEFLIPRYILLSPDGEIVHKNLPRPSNMELLKETLEKIFADIQ